MLGLAAPALFAVFDELSKAFDVSALFTDSEADDASEDVSLESAEDTVLSEDTSDELTELSASDEELGVLSSSSFSSAAVRASTLPTYIFLKVAKSVISDSCCLDVILAVKCNLAKVTDKLLNCLYVVIILCCKNCYVDSCFNR